MNLYPGSPQVKRPMSRCYATIVNVHCSRARRPKSASKSKQHVPIESIKTLHRFCLRERYMTQTAKRS